MEKKKLSQNQIDALQRKLPDEAVQPHPTKTYLSSIKAIYVVERFNEVFGIGGWFINNEVVRTEGKWVVVKSRFESPEYGIVIPDIFGGNDNADLGDAYKGACTDALTKIGSYLYVGIDVYKGKKGDNKGAPPSNKENEPDGKLWLNKLGPDKKTETEDWQKVTAALAAGKCDMKYVESKFKLSKAIKEELQKLVKPAA